VAERALLRSVLEQGGRHKIILPSLAVLSPGVCCGSAAELATSDVERLALVGVECRSSADAERAAMTFYATHATATGVVQHVGAD
jgi:hypothetical protein